VAETGGAGNRIGRTKAYLPTAAMAAMRQQ
jgi:hypothetical protein